MFINYVLSSLSATTFDHFRFQSTASISIIHISNRIWQHFRRRNEATDEIIQLIRRQPTNVSILIALNRLGREEMLLRITKELKVASIFMFIVSRIERNVHLI